MTNELERVETVALPSVYDRARDVAAFLNDVGDAIFRSRMFGCETSSQGKILALECAARRTPPLALAERYHLIKGKLSMKAEAMLADFNQVVGGSHEIVERSPEKAAVKLVRNRKSRTFTLTWEEVLAEPFVYSGREDEVVAALTDGKADSLVLKAKYATPRSRMQMLWARVVSDGVRAMAPEVVAGHYTPEEVADFSGVEVVPAEPDEADAAAGEAEKPAKTGGNEGKDRDADQPQAAADDSIQAQREAAKKQGLTTGLATGGADVAVAGGKATADQVARVKQLVGELRVSREKLTAMLRRAGIERVSDLPVGQCEVLIRTLEQEKARRAEGQAGN